MHANQNKLRFEGLLNAQLFTSPSKTLMLINSYLQEKIQRHLAKEKVKFSYCLDLRQSKSIVCH